MAEKRTLIGGRAQLVGISTELANHLRGVMKTFGLIVPKGGGRIFETNGKTLLEDQETLAAIMLPLALRLGARLGLRLGACKEPGSTANLSPWRARTRPAG